MPESPQPTKWFQDQFGDNSITAMKALAAAGHAAHERSLDAKAGSKLRTDDAYGSFWLSLPEELVSYLAFLPGVEILRPHRSRYDLLVYNGAVIFPAKCANDSAGPDKLKLRTSRLRKQLFALETRVADEPLDFGDFDFDFDPETDTPPLVPDFGSATALILVAYDCTARGGLQHIYVGEATLLDDGTVSWIYREELPLRALDYETILLSLVTDEPPTRFDDAPIPESILELRQPDANLEADEIEDPAVERDATGTTDDDGV